MITTYGSRFFSFGEKILARLQDYEYLSGHYKVLLSFLQFMFSPRGSDLLFLIAVVGFAVTLIHAVNQKEQLSSNVLSQDSQPRQKESELKEARRAAIRGDPLVL